MPGPVSQINAADADAQTMASFQKQPTGQKQATLFAALELYKTELAQDGKYDCCVKPGCNECVIRTGECHCRIGVEKGGPCCGECTAAWIEGRGNVAGVDREKVLSHLGCVRELYEKKMPETAAPVTKSGTTAPIAQPAGHSHH